MGPDAASEPQGEPEKKKAKGWTWLFSLYMVWNVVGRHVISWVLDGLVTLGGYGFSNAFLGLVALGVSFILVQRKKVKYEKLEKEGDPDPLPASTDYVTQAQVGHVMGWLALIAGWAGSLAWLIHFGPAAALTVPPVVGTAAFMSGRAGMAHARVMDARRGRPPVGGEV